MRGKATTNRQMNGRVFDEIDNKIWKTKETAGVGHASVTPEGSF